MCRAIAKLFTVPLLCRLEDGVSQTNIKCTLRSDENPPSKTPDKKKIELREWYVQKNLRSEHAECFEVIASFMKGKFFEKYELSSKVKTAQYLVESFLFGEMHNVALVEAGTRPQKTYVTGALDGFKFIDKYYSKESFSDFLIASNSIKSLYSDL